MGGQVLHLLQLERGWALGAKEEAKDSKLAEVQENTRESTDFVEGICFSVVQLGDVVLIHWQVDLLVEVRLSCNGLSEQDCGFLLDQLA